MLSIPRLLGRSCTVVILVRFQTAFAQALSMVLIGVRELQRAVIAQSHMAQKQGCVLTGIHQTCNIYTHYRLSAFDAMLVELIELVTVRVIGW